MHHLSTQGLFPQDCIPAWPPLVHMDFSEHYDKIPYPEFTLENIFFLDMGWESLIEYITMGKGFGELKWIPCTWWRWSFFADKIPGDLL